MSAHEQLTECIKKLGVKSSTVTRKVAGKNNIALGGITPHNINQVRTINAACFPLVYGDHYYTEVRGSGELAQLAYYNDVSVGAVCCRIDNSTDKKSLYVMTFGVLPTYRKFGVGALLMDYTFKLAEKDESIKTVSLHVHVDNQFAMEFYKKHGFEQQGLVEHFYTLLPSIDMNEEAYLLVKKIRE